MAGEYKDHYTEMILLAFEQSPEHTLKAPRPYRYNRGYIYCKLFCAADNLTMLYPNTAV